MAKQPRPLPRSSKKPRPLPHHLAAPLEENPGSAGVGVSFDDADPKYLALFDTLLHESLALFASEVLGMRLSEHINEWSDQVSQFSRLWEVAARDHGKSAFFSYAFPIWRAWGDPGCEVYIFSRTLDQAKDLLAIIVWGRNNLRGLVDIPALAHLVPKDEAVRQDRKVRLNRSDVILTNGSRIRAVGWGKAMRGRHPKYVVCDDVLNDNDLYSEVERKKNISYFTSAVSNMVMPSTQHNGWFEGGQLVGVGTPYHIADLNAWIENNPRYKFFRYPGIKRDAQGNECALFPWRWSLQQLYDKKSEIGPIAFSREILCLPITDDIAIFPSYLWPPLYDKQIKLRPSLAEIESRQWEIYMGVDIARSASVGADYFVIFVLAKDPQGTRYVVDIHRSKGLSFRDQLAQIGILAAQYNPAQIYIESNAMQQVYTDEIRRMSDLPVKEFITHATNKYPLDKGIPGLRILLENKKLIIPRGDDYSQQTTDAWIGEAQQFGFVDGKLQGVGSHDDLVMAWWFAEEAARAGGFSFAFDEEQGNDGLDTPDGEGDEDYTDILIGPPDERGDSGNLFGVAE